MMKDTASTNLTQWFSEHLKSSAEEFVWAVQQVPALRRTIAPPERLSAWSVARHVFHLLAYEEHIALPSMRIWLGEPFPSIDHLDEDALWNENAGRDLNEMLEKFREGRAAQIELLSQLSDMAWEETRDALWGQVTLLWVVTKTFQHTAEHIHDILTLALFWDNAVRRMQEQKGN
jgi:hypothetical protein